MKCKLCQKFYERYPVQEDKNDIDVSPNGIHKCDGYNMSAIQCAFDGKFEDNWNCQTVNEIRDICFEGQEFPYEVDYKYCDDMKYVTIKIDDIEEVNGMALWVSWYKNRGTTDAMWILDSYNEPRRPTEKECLAIIEYFKKKQEKEKCQKKKQ